MQRPGITRIPRTTNLKISILISILFLYVNEESFKEYIEEFRKIPLSFIGDLFLFNSTRIGVYPCEPGGDGRGGERKANFFLKKNLIIYLELFS